MQVDYIQTWFGENQIFGKSDIYSVAILPTLVGLTLIMELPWLMGCYCTSRMVKHPKTQPNEGAWVVPPPFRCWISRKSDLLKIMSECYPLALRCFRWQYRLVMHYIKSTHSGYLEAKGFQDLSTYSWESHMKTIASNFWTHCKIQTYTVIDSWWHGDPIVNFALLVINLT